MVPQVTPHDGEPSDYDLPSIPAEEGGYELYAALIAAALPAMVSVFYSDTEAGQALRDCEMCESMGEEGYIAHLAISQANTTITRMRNPSA